MVLECSHQPVRYRRDSRSNPQHVDPRTHLGTAIGGDAIVCLARATGQKLAKLEFFRESLLDQWARCDSHVIWTRL